MTDAGFKTAVDVGQTGSLRRIGNPPATRHMPARTGRLTTGRRMPSCPRCVAIAILLCVPAGAQPSSDLPPHVLLLARIRHRASVDFAHIPNFTCRETIQRFRGRAGKPLKQLDTVEVEVANIGGRELFAWPGETHFEERSIIDMVGSGMVSDGEYIADARNVLVGGVAQITYHGVERIEGRDAARYDFRFTPALSPYTLVIGDAKAVIGEQGSFWADPVTYTLLRLSFAGTEIPDWLGVRATNVEIHYGRTRIGDVAALLPVKAVSGLTEARGDAVSNEIGFTACRQYTAESVILSEAPPDVASAPPLAAAPSPGAVVLPLGYDIDIRLTSGIDLNSAKVGDPIDAELESDLKTKREVFAPKGARVHGRIRLLRKYGDGYAIGLELDEVSVGQNRVRIAATLVDVDARYTMRSRTSRAAVTEILPEIEGVSTFVTPQGVDTLPRGMRMQWKIIGAGE